MIGLEQGKGTDMEERMEETMEGENRQEHLLDEVLLRLDKLQSCFEERIAQDTYKNQLFDNMHKELVRYQNGFAEKLADGMALEIIQLTDSSERSLELYGQKEPTEENFSRLLKVLQGVVEELQDILYRQGIEPYSVEEDEVDVKRQKIIATVKTDVQADGNHVAERTAKGYEKNGRVLRPERIKIYKYQPANQEETGSKGGQS